MLPLKKKTIWKKEVTDDDKNVLIVRIEKEQIISVDPPPDKITHTLEICSPGRDRRGQEIKKCKRVAVDRALFQEIKEGISALAQLPSDSRRRQDRFLETRCECSEKLVITLESPPFEDISHAQIKYVIGIGNDVRFVFETFDELDKLRWDLENVIV
jgi:hypothetical protein